MSFPSAKDDDSDGGSDTGPISPNSSERSRARNSRFASWLRDTQVRNVHKVKHDAKSAADEELSIRELLAKQESTQIITDPREYQIELFERAKNQNTIAVLDTGSGKTLIAVLLLRHVIDTELEDRVNGRPPRVAFFLVPSVTLVFQQFAVLERNLDHKVDRFCGAMNCRLWTKEVWDKHLAENHVIVCTADVLKDCLNHSFVSMRQINLLIFDEAHHAKKGHAYAQIVKDFYPTDADDFPPPRIFGMTASPVDAKVDVRRAARDLERILSSQIATASDLSLLRKAVNKPDEHVLSYPAPNQNPPKGDLYHTLKAEFGDIDILQRMFDRASAVNSHLGLWCSDRYWSLALADKRFNKLTSRTEKPSNPNKSSEIIESEIEYIQEAMDIVSNHDFGEPRPSNPDLSLKVLRLYDFLSHEFERPNDHRCIVFVEQRVTALLLKQVFDAIGGSNLRAGSIVGSGSDRLNDLQSTFRDHVVTMIKFRKGEVNCLFATSVAEEGLDIPDCNTVVRFDICKTMIQYVQSRGRARHGNSKFLHMKQIDNSAHDNIMAENMQAEFIMRKFCEALPADRKLGEDDASLTASQVNRQKSCTIKATGAKITYGSALQILSHFVDSLPRDGEEDLKATYVPSHLAGKFSCEVLLPEPSPIRSVLGDPSQNRSLAKRSAAYNTCVQLYEQAYLSDNLVPIYTKRLPSMRNAALALSSKTSGMYDMRNKPCSWEHGRGLMPSAVYFTLLDVPDGLDRPHQPLLLVSREPMPSFPEFPLYLRESRQVFVKSKSFQTSYEVTESELVRFTTFTLRMFRDIFNKTYEYDVLKLPYWLVPADHTADSSRCEKLPQDLIDWNILAAVQNSDAFQWVPEMPDSFLLDKFLIDRWDGGKRFFTTRVATEYKPSDPVPKDVASVGERGNIIDYTVSLWKKARATKTWNLQQPVVEAEKVLHRRNMLAEPGVKEESLRTKVFLCPEPLRISAIPPKLVTMCYMFPAVIHRIESYLIAKETCEALGLNVDIPLALEAITKDSDSTEDHQNHERINFQRGMGKNYERLEFLGDCFLKMATSMSVFTQNPNENEFDYHVKRMLLLCNKNLFNVAQKLKLHENIRSKAFSRRTWYPDGLKLLEGKGSKKDSSGVMKHPLGDKTIADVCEALMGAAFLTHDRPGEWRPEHWRDAVVAVTKLVDSPDHTMTEWADYSRAYEIPPYQIGHIKAEYIDLARKVEEKHPYRFRYPRLLKSAFHHPSYPTSWTDKIPTYQRLEFLGDSLLDMAGVTHLYYRYPDKDPQWLTEHKMAMVSNQFLGALCVKIGLHKHLLHNHESLSQQIEDYVIEITTAEQESDGRVDYWTTIKEAPKCLPDMVEAYVGAVFIDADFDYNQVQRFFDRHVKPFFEDMAVYDSFANNHPVTKMQNTLRDNYGCNDWQLLAGEETTGDGTKPEVVAGLMIHDCAEPVGCWRAKSGRYARVKSALAVLEELKGLAPCEFRARFGCDCHLAEDGGGG